MVPQRGVLSGESCEIRAWISSRAERLKSVDLTAVPEVSTSRNLRLTGLHAQGECLRAHRAHTIRVSAPLAVAARAAALNGRKSVGKVGRGIDCEGTATRRSTGSLAAGDLNMFYGATRSRLALPERDRTVWERMDARGLEFLGPQAPHGRRADSATDVPADTKNVPTLYYQGRGQPERLAIVRPAGSRSLPAQA